MNNELIQWFYRHRDDKPDNLAHSKTWIIMRQNLKTMGYWKNKARGNPKAGYKAQQSNTTGGESTYHSTQQSSTTGSSNYL